MNYTATTKTNAALMIDQQIKHRPVELALWLPPSGKFRWFSSTDDKDQDQSKTSPHHGGITFNELDLMARRAAGLLLQHGISPGDRILLAIELSYDLYAWVLAATRLGATVLLVEPWLKLADIEKILESQKPRFFVAHTMGRLWGLRVPGVRQIPHKIAAQNLLKVPPIDHETILVSPESACLMAFTSGTTGQPKGLVRSHQYLNAELDILNNRLLFNQIEGSDLVIFANFTLANLANGRLSLIMPSRWSLGDIKALDALPEELKPRSVTTGPAYMRALLEHSDLTTLRHIHLGGALTPNWFFDQLFVRFPEAHITHLYGSSEAEPVAMVDAREAVKKSRERGFYHTLCVGSPIPEVSLKQVDSQSLWVSGPHVSPEYLGNPTANLDNKFRDATGVLWHRMGDRVQAIDFNLQGDRLPMSDELYYLGRDHQSLGHMLDEQRLYHLLNHDHAFLEPQLQSISQDCSKKTPGAASYDLYLDPHPEGSWLKSHHPQESLRSLTAFLRRTLPGIQSVFLTSIVRDKRHRARIDRVQSKQKAKQYV